MAPSFLCFSAKIHLRMDPKGQPISARADITPPRPASRAEVVEHIPVKQPTEPTLPTVTQLPKSIAPVQSEPADDNDKELDQILKETSKAVRRSNSKKPERQLIKLRPKTASQTGQATDRPSAGLILVSLAAIAVAIVLIIMAVRVYRNGGTI